MSNFQAVATVTAALRERLLETVIADVPAATVTTLRPADPGTSGIPAVGVNLFLFAVHISASHRNRDLPLRSGTGDTRQVPIIPLELDYLVSFYGDANGAAHQLVGSVMRSLYARPILTAAMIQAVETPASGLNSGLANQADRVRLTPLTLPIEEIAKLWSVFVQSSYTLSVAFRASPVLIEADQPLTQAPPVATPQLAAFPLAPPRIDGIVAQGGGPILPGSTIVVSGAGFDPATATLLIGAATVTPGAASHTSLTAALDPALPAGKIALQVQQGVSIGDPPVLRPGPVSAPAAFLLHPLLTGASLSGGIVSVVVQPAIGPAQAVTLALLDAAGTVQHLVRAPDRIAPAGTIAIPLGGVAAGTYGVRLTVDGADSVPKGPAVPQVMVA